MMFFSPIKEINRSFKEMNRLLNKGMSNIYLEVTIEKKWRTLILKVPLRVSFWGAPTHADIIEFSNFLLQLKN